MNNHKNSYSYVGQRLFELDQYYLVITYQIYDYIIITPKTSPVNRWVSTEPGLWTQAGLDSYIILHVHDELWTQAGLDSCIILHVHDEHLSY